MRARGRRPSSLARSAVIISTAAAPSEICDDEPAVCTPSSRATGLSVGQLLERGLAQALVAVDAVGRAGGLAVLVDVGRVDRDDLRVEAALGPRARRPAAATARPKRVAVVAGDAPLVGDALGALELRGQLVAARSTTSGSARPKLGLAHAGADRHAAHRLDAARRRRRRRRPRATSDAARLVACCDEPHWAVDGGGGDRERQPGGEPGGAGDVERLLADLADAAADDLADLGRVDARALDDRLVDRAEEVGGVDGGEAAVAPPDGACGRLRR